MITQTYHDTINELEQELSLLKTQTQDFVELSKGATGLCDRRCVWNSGHIFQHKMNISEGYGPKLLRPCLKTKAGGRGKTLRALDAFLLTVKRHDLPVQYCLFAFQPVVADSLAPFSYPDALEVRNRYVEILAERYPNNLPIRTILLQWSQTAQTDIQS